MKNTHVVLGLSAAGAAAAMNLANGGFEVRLFALLDDVPIRAWHRVVLDSIDGSGSDVEARLEADLRSAGVIVEEGEYQFETLSLDSGSELRTNLKKFAGNTIQVRSTNVVVAPNGIVSEIVLPEGWMKLAGKGISESVWSDVPYFRGKTVFVAGCSRFTVDQALFATSFQANTTILCDSTMLTGSIPSEVSLVENAKITGWKITDDRLSAIHFRIGTLEEERDCDALFIAPNLVTPPFVRSLPSTTNVRLAGIAAGIDAGDHESLYRSGLRVVTEKNV